MAGTRVRGVVVVRVLDSGLVGLISTLGMVCYEVATPQFAAVYSAANEYQNCWGGTCDGLASRPGESTQLHSKLLTLNETKLKHWPSLPVMAT